MSDNTKIEWTEATWNPVTGCAKVSQGCKHCYAERDWARLSANPATRYYGRPFTDMQCHDDVLELPLRWTKSRRIFVNSMSDLFHEAVPDAFIDRVFAVMAQAPQHTFQVLTKRPARMQAYLSDEHRLEKWMDADIPLTVRHWGDYPLPNVWLGVSVEDQTAADERIPLLLGTPAAVRWISAEPLLGPVDLTRVGYDEDNGADFGGWADCDAIGSWGNALTGEWFSALRSASTLRGEEKSFTTSRIDWVVLGGESGPKARAMHPEWVRSLRNQCFVSAVPFLFKQWGEWAPDWEGAMTCANCGATKFDACVRDDECGRCGTFQWKEASKPLDTMRRVGKKLAGRLLDGVQHDEYPEASSC